MSKRWEFRGRIELEKFWRENGICPDECCIIGGLVYNAYGLREHGDIDFVTTTEVIDRLKQKYEVKQEHCLLIPFCVDGEEGDIKISRFAPLGVGDDDIVNNNKYHIVYDGLKVLRFELAYAIRLFDLKRFPNNPKALNDVLLGEKMMTFNASFSWGGCYTMKQLSKLCEFLEENNITSDKYAITSGFNLFLSGIKTEYNDFDLIVEDDVFEILANKYGVGKYNKNLITISDGEGEYIDILKDKFRCIGYSNDVVIKKYTRIVNDFPAVRLELMLALRNIEQPNQRAVEDTLVLGDYALAHSIDWDWSLVTDGEEAVPANNEQNSLKRYLYKFRPANWGHIFFFWGPKLLRRLNPFRYLSRGINKLLTKKNNKKQQKGMDAICVLSPTNIFVNQINADHRFDAYDTVIRYGVVEEDLSEMGRYWHDLYKKMQEARGFYDSHNENTFRNLIGSLQKRGINYNMPVSLTKSGMLTDGSHRLASALFFEYDYVGVKYEKVKFKARDFDLRYFKQIGFGQEELSNLIKHKNKIMFRSGAFFPVNIWPPAYEYSDEIEKIVKSSSGIRLVKRIKIMFEDVDEFERYVWDIYDTDDVDKWKVARKIAYMKKYPHNVTVFWIQIDDPCFRRKTLNENYLSMTAADLKEKIRKQIRAYIKDYIFDIICHIGDNYKQNAQMNKIIKSYRKIDLDSFTNTLD